MNDLYRDVLVGMIYCWIRDSEFLPDDAPDDATETYIKDSLDSFIAYSGQTKYSNSEWETIARRQASIVMGRIGVGV